MSGRPASHLRCTLPGLIACVAILAQLQAGASVAVAAQTGDDALNERPPVTRIAREHHWGIDCARLREELLHALAEAPSAGDLARWDRELGLCAAIHNTPGSTDAGACPDHAAARRALQRVDTGTEEHHGNLRAEMRKYLQCE